jgi:SAM-dependent methyltransferase
MGAATDKAGARYWDDLWAAATPPAPINPRDPSVGNYENRRFHDLFRTAIPYGSNLLEVGCARSRWLPYFALELGCTVTGLDYSERGCGLEVEVLQRAGVEGAVVCADLFAPPDDMLGRFDVAVSLGVVEHIADTAEAIAALRRYLAPGGLLVTVIPNLAGVLGHIQRMFGRAVYDIHVPLTTQQLAAAHGDMHVLDCRYFVSTNFSMLVIPNRATLGRLSKIVWAVEDRTRPLPATKVFAPYIVTVAQHR